MEVARAGITRVMLPARNRKDTEDLSEETRRQLELIFLERVEDAMGAALEEKPVTVAAE